MKKLLLLFVLLTLLIPVAQAQYGNEWINYNQTYLKFKVLQEGWYRIPYQILANAGVPVTSVNGMNYQVFAKGVEIPIYVTTTGIIGSNDYIEFFATINDGSQDTKLYPNPAFQPNERVSVYNDTGYYFLTWNSLTTNNHYISIANNISNPPPKELYCLFTSEQRSDTPIFAVGSYGRHYFDNYSNGPYLSDGYFDSEFMATKGYTGHYFDRWGYGSQSHPIATPYPYSGGPLPEYRAAITFWGTEPHFMDISVNGNLLIPGTVAAGFYVVKPNVTIPSQSWISHPSTNILHDVSNSPATDFSQEYYAIGWQELKYAREFNFNNETFVKFSLPGGGGNKYLEIDNFNVSGSVPVLYDLTTKVRLEAVIQGSTLQFLLPPSVQERNLMLLAHDTLNVMKSVGVLYPVQFTDYSIPANQGNVMVISHPFFFDDGTGANPVANYADTLNLLGKNAKVANILELYDEFAYGTFGHPNSIRNLAEYILDAWPQADYYFFLIGRGFAYVDGPPIGIWQNPSNVDRFYIPTFGEPGSDAMLTSTADNPISRIPVGRLPIIDHQSIFNYTGKMYEYLSAQKDTADQYPPSSQTNANDAWKKHVLHLVGGTNEDEAIFFRTIMDGFANFIEDTALYGGQVTTIAKESNDPLPQDQSEYMHDLISNGVSLITFFGHSSTSSFDFDMDVPENYINPGKYPLFLTNGCLLGNIFNYFESIPEKWTCAKKVGSIGFIAPASFSYLSTLQTFSDNFYRNLSLDNYNRPIGNVLEGAISDVIGSNGSVYAKIQCQQMHYVGDPSIIINTHNRPDYIIETGSVSFNPALLTAGLDEFEMQIIITNVGRGITDSLYVTARRFLPDGDSVLLYHQLIQAPYYKDTIVIAVATNGLESFGQNEFQIKVDQGASPFTPLEDPGDISEIAEHNNYITVPKFITAADIAPIYPYQFSIVNDPGVTLKASTVDPFASDTSYIFQIDTTELFSSPLMQQSTITQSGGVVSWTPPISLLDSTVYYWRVSVVPSSSGIHNWHYTSFIVIENSSPGWNQSHYFQFVKDSSFSANIEMPPSRVWKYVDDNKSVSVYNGLVYPPTVGGPLNVEQPAWFLNGAEMLRYQCLNYGGIMIAVIDSTSGLEWKNPWDNPLYNAINCNNYDFRGFIFDTENNTNNQDVVNFLNGIPDGNYVLMQTWSTSRIQDWDPSVIAAFTVHGASIDTFTSEHAYVCFFKKGSSTYLFSEVVGDSVQSILNPSYNIVGQWDQGYIESPLIGPAVDWTDLHWRTHEVEAGDDTIALSITGVQADGTEVLLNANVLQPDLSLSFIDPLVYPYIKLRLFAMDTTNRTPIQLDLWRVNYQPVPEAALNPAEYFYLSSDTVSQFIPLSMGIAVTNVTPWPMDSMQMKFAITDALNGYHEYQQKYDSLPGNSSIQVNYDFPTDCDCFTGINYLLVEANPFGITHQPEQFHWNNTGVFSFHVTDDQLNPLLDVTFDGVHIMDGDIVSAEPTISISLKDESEFLALSNDSLFDIYYLYPDGSRHDILFDGTVNIFYPADESDLEKNNTAKAELNPVFDTDGIYELVVQGYDRSGNASGDNSYRISFEVINKPMLSNVLNYPNPFSTSTRFIFTLTGSDVPQFMKIQIMTISGKVVKEILMNDLGNVHIGTNISDFVWDGTDQYGDKLANGLYFYRVVARLDNKSMEHYNNGTDTWFKNGIGKMYLMR